MNRIVMTYNKIAQPTLEMTPIDQEFINNMEKSQLKFLICCSLKYSLRNLIPIGPHHCLTEDRDKEILETF